MPNTVRTAIFPVAGLGTRFLPATKVMPKEMLTVVDKPLIQYAVEEARAAGIETFVFVTGRGKAEMEDHFDRAPELENTLKARNKDELLALADSTVIRPGHAFFTRQQEPLGLGHAVLCARALCGPGPVAILLPDDMVQGAAPCLKQMVDAHQSVGGNLIAAMDVPLDQTSKYGIITPGTRKDRLVEVTGLVEKPRHDPPSTLAVIGRYILQPEVFDFLERGERGAGGEIQLTDAIAKLVGRQPFHGFLFEGERFDCGDKLGFIEANLSYGYARDEFRTALAARMRALLG